MREKLLFLFFSWLFAQCGQAQHNQPVKRVAVDSVVLSNRALVKEYFLCKCIDNGFPEAELLAKKDHSLGVLVEMASYEPEAFKRLDSLANKVVSGIPVSNLTRKKGVMVICIDYYNGKELDDFVATLDNRMNR